MVLNRLVGKMHAQQALVCSQRLPCMRFAKQSVKNQVIILQYNVLIRTQSMRASRIALALPSLQRPSYLRHDELERTVIAQGAVPCHCQSNLANRLPESVLTTVVEGSHRQEGQCLGSTEADCEVFN